MLYLLIIVLSVLAFFALIKMKDSMKICYRRFRMWIWHRWIMWRIERRLPQTSIEMENCSQTNFERG